MGTNHSVTVAGRTLAAKNLRDAEVLVGQLLNDEPVGTVATVLNADGELVLVGQADTLGWVDLTRAGLLADLAAAGHASASEVRALALLG